MENTFSARLRSLRTKNGWTTAEMSYMTSLPKRSLEKYMLRDNASLPGFEALVSLSKGLGVSLDWLVFGSEVAGASIKLIVNRCATETSLVIFETILNAKLKGDKSVFNGEEILNLSVEEWASEIGYRASDLAEELILKGVTREELQYWIDRRKDRLTEILRGRFDQLVRDKSTQT